MTAWTGIEASQEPQGDNWAMVGCARRTLHKAIDAVQQDSLSTRAEPIVPDIVVIGTAI